MPEGDTVWNTARVLHRALAGARLTGSDFRVPQLATTDLAGWTVRESASRGKHLLLRLTAPPATGRRLDAPLPPADGRRLAGVRPGGTLDGPAGAPDPGGAAQPGGGRGRLPPARAGAGAHRRGGARCVGHLGPDLLGTDWDPDEAVRRLAAAPGA